MLAALSTGELLLAALILATAFVVRGITGFGSGLIAIPLLVLMLPVAVVVPMVGLLDYLAAATHGGKYRRHIRWQALLPLLPFSLLGITAALYLFRTVDAQLLPRILGGFVLLYAFYTLITLRRAQANGTEPAPPRSRLWAIPAGGLGGLVGALFGTGGPFYVIYLGLRRLQKTEFRATIAAVFLIDGGMRQLGYVASGLHTLDTIILVGAALPIMAAGLYVGGHIHTTISHANFQRAIGILLLGSGAALLLK